MSPLTKIDFTDPEALEQDLSAASEELAVADGVPAGVRDLAESISQSLIDLTPAERPDIDPYVLTELMRLAAIIQRTLHLDDEDQQVAELEIEVEALREILDDVVAGVPVSPQRDVLEVARWLKEILHASNPELHSLLGPSARTWERWLAPTPTSAPTGDDEARIRIAAQIVNQLRYGLTPRGVLRWFELPHPLLDDEAPKTLLEDTRNAPRLVALAAQTRRSDAS